MIIASSFAPTSPGLLGAWAFPIHLSRDFPLFMGVALLIAGRLLSHRWAYATAACYIAVPLMLLPTENFIYAPAVHIQAAGLVGLAITVPAAVGALWFGRMDLLDVVPLAVISYQAVARFAGLQAFLAGGHSEASFRIVSISIVTAEVAAFFLIAGIRELRA